MGEHGKRGRDGGGRDWQERYPYATICIGNVRMTGRICRVAGPHKHGVGDPHVICLKKEREIARRLAGEEENRKRRREAATRRAEEGMRRAAMKLSMHKNLRIRKQLLRSMDRVTSGRGRPGAIENLMDRGLVVWWDGGGRPKLTLLGRAVMMAGRLNIRFLDACILAVIYRLARRVPGDLSHVRAGMPRVRSCGQLALIPMEALEYYLVDWLCSKGTAGKSISGLRKAGLLSKSHNRLVACDVRHLSGIHDVLVELDGWVWRVDEEVRRMLGTPGQNSSSGVSDGTAAKPGQTP